MIDISHAAKSWSCWNSAGDSFSQVRPEAALDEAAEAASAASAAPPPPLVIMGLWHWTGVQPLETAWPLAAFTVALVMMLPSRLLAFN